MDRANGNNAVKMPLSEVHQGTPRADAGCGSSQTISGGTLNRRTPTGIAEKSTADDSVVLNLATDSNNATSWTAMEGLDPVTPQGTTRKTVFGNADRQTITQPPFLDEDNHRQQYLVTREAAVILRTTSWLNYNKSSKQRSRLYVLRELSHQK